MRKVFLTAGLYAFILQQALASSVTLGWTASPDSNLAYYNLYYGAASQVYTNKSPVGTNTTDTIAGLVPGTTYYFAATTMDTGGLESGYSSEVSYLVPADQLLPCTVTLGNLTQIYTGQAATVTVSTDPTNLPVSILYNGSLSGPTNAGSYTVIATVVSSNYTGAATNTLTIAPAPATITLANLAQTYDGTAKTVSITTQPAGLPTVVTYNGLNVAPTNSGNYVVICSITGVNYSGSATNTLSITRAVATITLGNLSRAYDGTGKTVSVTTQPAGLPTEVTYNGSTPGPTNAGSYTVIASVASSNYTGAVTNMLAIVPAPATITLANLAQTYSGAGKTVSVATQPTGVPTVVTYNGSASAPTNAGNYTVIASVASSNYTGAATNTLAIAPAPATITLANLAQTYDGTAKTVSITTQPAGVPTAVTYNGLNVAPTNSGNYVVICSITSVNYSGSATNTLSISPAVATITLGNLSQAYDGTGKTVSVTTQPAGLPTAVTYNGSPSAPTNTGNYTVIATVVSSNYTGAATNVLAIVPVAITLADLVQTYDGTAKTVSVTTQPAGLPTVVTYNGGLSAPTNAGSYTVIASLTSSNYTGAATNTLTIAPAPATITLTNLVQTYSGVGKTVSVTTQPTGLPTVVTYNGSPSAPTNAGNYTVIASVASSNYTGAATNTLAIAPAPATITLANLVQTYDGTGKTVSAITQPAGLPTVVTYNGSASAPTNAGNYTVIASVASSNYTGAATNTLAIAPAPATITLADLAQTYDGTAKTVSITTQPAGVPTAVTYNGLNVAPTNSGNYVVICSITSVNYSGSATNTLSISPAVATITLGNLSQAYDGTGKTVSVTTQPAGLPTAVTYNGSPSAPTNTGNYTVIATVVSSNYTGAATNVLAIVPVTITLTNLVQTYDGTAKTVSVTTQPAGLPTVVTYNGSTSAPTNAGSYTVIATLTSPIYAGTATNTLTIAPAPATITLTNLVQTYDGAAKTVSVTTQPTGLPTVVSYNGGTSAPTNAGNYTVTASMASSNYTGAATNLLTIAPAPATITLTNLAQTYDGTGKTVSITTQPAGLPAVVAYNGLNVAPTNSGNYVVICSITDINYSGSATNSLSITPALATITLSNLAQTYNGTARTVTITTVPTNLATMITYNGSASAPVNAGTYAVAASPINTNYTGSATNTLTIGKAAASIAISGLSQTYNGKPKSVTVITTPRNLVCTITYNGSSAAPSAVGSYTVIATIVNSNYMGSATNTLRIGKTGWKTASSSTDALSAPTAGVIVQLSGLIQACTGKPCPVAVATVPSGLNVTVTYNGSNQAPSDIGSYTVVAEVSDTNYAGTVTSVLTIVGVAPPSNLVIVSWSSAFSGVTLLESSNLVDWQANSTPANAWTASSDSTGATGAAVAVQPGCRFFRAVTNGAAIPFTIQQ